MRRGVVALGDSITRGRGGSPALGIHFQSWTQWLAEALELPLTNLAADGAVATDVLAGQVPRLRGPYDLGLLHVGVNDARRPDWDPETYARDVASVAEALRAACDRVAVLTLPEDLGRPTAAPKPAAANRILRALGGVEIVELADLRGRRHVLPDAVHPTAAGMVEIARRAAATLAPGATVGEEHREAPGPVRLARYEAWWWRLWLRDVLRRARERRQYAGR